MNVLLFQSREDLATRMREFLEKRGHQVVVAGNAAAAWDRCADREFPLVFLDWVLPGEPGLELCRTIRSDSRFRFSLLVMMSENKASEDLALALGAGVDDFIVRPIDWERLEIRIAIAERRVALLHDRSRVQAALEESEKLEKDLLERTARLTSVGVLAAGFAHEINNPLQGMLSHLSNIRRHTPSDSMAAESLDMVDRGIRTISSLVRRLLVLGMETDLTAGATSCDEAISFVSTLLHSQLAKAGVTLTIDHEDPNMQVALSQRQLIQVLLNLVLNAVEAMPGGGSIRVRTGSLNGLASIEVTDTGSGMSEDTLREIFVPFYTTKGARGSGLGLSMCEAIVRNADGRMDVVSEEGHGTTFTILVPVAAQAESVCGSGSEQGEKQELR